MIVCRGGFDLGKRPKYAQNMHNPEYGVGSGQPPHISSLMHFNDEILVFYHLWYLKGPFRIFPEKNSDFERSEIFDVKISIQSLLC